MLGFGGMMGRGKGKRGVEWFVWFLNGVSFAVGGWLWFLDSDSGSDSMGTFRPKSETGGLRERLRRNLRNSSKDFRTMRRKNLTIYCPGI